MKSILKSLAILFIFLAAAVSADALEFNGPVVIVRPADPGPMERLAAKEIRRYVYLRTGRLPVLDTPSANVSGLTVFVARKDRELPPSPGDAGFREDAAALGPEEYLIRTVTHGGRSAVAVIGGDDAGVLYGAYRFAELIGVRFYLHGDVVPDRRGPLSLPDLLDVRGKPLFDVRGIQPFHDFPEGPDWWNRDDYRAIFSQLPKLGMNFFGLHTYPEGGPNAEPTVWIGPPDETGEKGMVSAAYSSSYQNSLRGNWGYTPRKTGDYTRGASLLFDRDDYGADVMRGYMPQPDSADAKGAVEVFNRTGELLRDVFTFARSLGIRTCVGTETPLVVPREVRRRLLAQGKDPGDSTVTEDIYEGMFRRIRDAYPVDYYWFWTPEGWTWSGTSEETVQKTLLDLRTARRALERAGNPFRLATCGWVLGPERNRALFTGSLSPDWTLSCINRGVGWTPVDPAFRTVDRHPSWAIPWLEDDPALTVPQLWAGRMRCDAADALRYGCDGLLGIHWRTRVLGPNVLALARAAWDQSPWKESQFSGPLDGRVFQTDLPIAGTADDALYQTMRTDLSEYRLVVPDGAYTVTLRFCEPEFGQAGERVFGIALQGRTVLERLDLFDRVGKLRACDFSFEGVRIEGGFLQINFLQVKGAPVISAIEAVGPEYARRINCGGPARGGFDADWNAIPARHRPTADFYDDWCLHEFGPDAGPGASAIFQRLDGALPRPADWVNGPGGIRPDRRPWARVAEQYAFVKELEVLRPRITGKGDRERFDYWLNTFRYLRAMGHLNCAWGEFTVALDRAGAAPDSSTRMDIARREALPKFRELPARIDDVYAYLFRTISTNGELGTVMNWESHLFPLLLDQPRAELEKVLGAAVEPPAHAREFSDEPRLIVPTVRTALERGESLDLKIIVLDSNPPKRAELLWRPMGAGAFARLPLAHVARGVYRASIPKPSGDIEYQVRVLTAGSRELVWPASAPEICQTVIVGE